MKKQITDQLNVCIDEQEEWESEIKGDEVRLALSADKEEVIFKFPNVEPFAIDWESWKRMVTILFAIKMGDKIEWQD